MKSPTFNQMDNASPAIAGAVIKVVALALVALIVYTAHQAVVADERKAVHKQIRDHIGSSQPLEIMDGKGGQQFVSVRRVRLF